jgi:glutamine synthetase
MGVTVPQVSREFSHGQYEISTRHGDPVTAVDNYYAVREAIRDTAAEFGIEATFMPKPYTDWLGNSLHTHVSVWDAEGATDLTPSDADDTSLSPIGKHVVGGILAHIDALTGLGSPSVNSYKRLQPGTWAPGNPYWGYNNRSGVIRIPGPGARRHIEYRASDNTAQPEMLLIGLMAAALHGIRDEIDPGEPFAGDVGHMLPDEIAAAGFGELPRNASAALDALERDEVIAEALGETALAHFLSVRRFEVAQHERHVHEWEREYYYDIY